jgi:hypothetical protein
MVQFHLTAVTQVTCHRVGQAVGWDQCQLRSQQHAAGLLYLGRSVGQSDMLHVAGQGMDASWCSSFVSVCYAGILIRPHRDSILWALTWHRALTVTSWGVVCSVCVTAVACGAYIPRVWEVVVLQPWAALPVA